MVQTLLEHKADPNICPPFRYRESISSSRYTALSPLSAAAFCGNSELVLLLTKFGANLNHCDKFGGTALHFAAGYDEMGVDDKMTLPRFLESARCYTSTVETLLSAGADVNVLDKFGASPLFLACGKGMTKLGKLLLSHGADPNTSTVETLLSAGADVNALDKTGASPLFLACGRSMTKLGKLLLSHGADPNNGCKDKLPIHAACEGKHYDSVKLLLEYRADVNACDEKGNTALHQVVKYIAESASLSKKLSDKIAALVQLLVEGGANANATSESGRSPIYVACSKGLTSIAKTILEHGAVVDVNSGRKLPLIAACRNNHVSIAQLLLAHGADPNVAEKGNTSLHVAALNGNSELVELLLKHGANVAVANTKENTALHLAVQGYHRRASSRYSEKDALSSRKSTTDILLENKADVNSLNREGETPLYAAASSELLDVVSKMLQMYGGNPNKGSPNKSPLAAACQKQNVKLVDMLLNHGADPNSYEVSTSCNLDAHLILPLFIAVNTRNTDIITSLLNAGASVNATDHEGRSAVCFAAEKLTGTGYYYSSEMNKSLSAIRLLLQHGANFNMLLPDGHSPLHAAVSVLPTVQRRGDEHDIACVLELLQSMVEHGAMLLDSSAQSEDIISGQSNSTWTLAALTTFNGKHKFILDLFLAGAGIQLIASCCKAVSTTSRRVKSIALCQAVVLAGYKPSAKELANLQSAVADANTSRIQDRFLKQLVDWLNEEKQQVPNLFRQCRIAIRRQLSTATQYRTIIPAIDQLPLPNDLKLYLQFDGLRTEVDLSVDNEQQSQTRETTEETLTEDRSSLLTAWYSDYDYSSDDDYVYDLDYNNCLVQ